MALAGPAANLTLMLLAAIVIRVGLSAHWFQSPSSIGTQNLAHVVELAGGTINIGTTFLSVLFTLNLLLAAFNLLPVPPLDGNVGITVLMGETTALRFVSWSQNPQFALLGLVAAWYGFGYIFSPLFFFAIRLLYPGVYS
jgi:Zn-dependent protease